MFGKYCDLSFR